MKITLCKRNGGWLLLLFLAIVVIIVAGIVIVGICQMAKKINKPEDKPQAVQEAWNDAVTFANRFAAEHDANPTNIMNIRLLSQAPQGHGWVESSGDGVNWTPDSSIPPMSIEEAQDWSEGWQSRVPPIDTSKPMQFYRVQVLITNQP